MTFSLDRRQFLMGSTALLAAGAAGLRPSFAADAALRQIFWGSQERANRTYKVNDLFAQKDGMKVESEDKNVPTGLEK